MEQESTRVESKEADDIVPELGTYVRTIARIGGGTDYQIFVDIEQLCVALSVWGMQKPENRPALDEVARTLLSLADSIKSEDLKAIAAARARSAAKTFATPTAPNAPARLTWWQDIKRLWSWSR